MLYSFLKILERHSISESEARGGEPSQTPHSGAWGGALGLGTWRAWRQPGCPGTALLLFLQVVCFLPSGFWVQSVGGCFHLWLFPETMSSWSLEEERGQYLARWCEWAAIPSLDCWLQQMWVNLFLSFAETVNFPQNVASAVIKDNASCCLKCKSPKVHFENCFSVLV